MTKRPVFHADLGRFFTQLRTARGLKSQRQAALVAKNRKLPVSYQVLQRLEAGRTKTPEPELLRALSALYDVPYEEIVRQWVARHFETESDLIRPDRDQESAHDTVAADRRELHTLRQQVAQYKEEAGKVHAIAESLIDAVVDLGKISNPSTKRSRRGGHHRKAS